MLESRHGIWRRRLERERRERTRKTRKVGFDHHDGELLFSRGNAGWWKDDGLSTTMTPKIMFVLCGLVLLLGDCEAKPILPSEFGFPAEEINTRVRLAAPAGWNTFQTRSHVELLIEVISADQIAFDHDARMFIYQGHEWVEVENVPTTYPDEKQILSPARGDLNKLGIVSVYPLLPDPNRSVTLRLVVVGNIVRDGEITQEQTAAYIDVRLRPK